MKKLVVISMALILIQTLVGTATAETSLRQGAFGFNVGVGNSILNDPAIQGSITNTTGSYVHGVINLTGKYMVQSDLALLGGFGLQSDGGDADATYYNLAFGVRKYLKTDNFAPFVEGKFTIESLDVDDGFSSVDIDVYDFSIGAGAEYFFHKQFSVEGSVGIGFGIAKLNTVDLDDRYFGTRSLGLSANFYF